MKYQTKLIALLAAFLIYVASFGPVAAIGETAGWTGERPVEKLFQIFYFPIIRLVVASPTARDAFRAYAQCWHDYGHL